MIPVDPLSKENLQLIIPHMLNVKHQSVGVFILFYSVEFDIT